MNLQVMEDRIYELIVQASARLPLDVRTRLEQAIKQEDPTSKSAMALRKILQNLEIAKARQAPICQDTGLPTFLFHLPRGGTLHQMEVEHLVQKAIVRATRDGSLRPNSVDPLTGENSGDNLGPMTPIIYIKEWTRPTIGVQLILKGGGCENKSTQYSLPCELDGLGYAERDLAGIRKCILHAVWQAQGQGCSPGFIGVGIGSDRAGGYALAKQQLFRTLDDTNKNPVLQQLEGQILAEANTLDIGTLGFGGDVTLLGCKIDTANRLPASFFVSIAYMCWAFRRVGFELDEETGEITEWHDYVDTDDRNSRPQQKRLDQKTIALQTPISEETVRKLKVGDVVEIHGMMYTGRDEIHRYLASDDAICPVDLGGQIIYHCGPVMLKNENSEWHVLAAGPTTSSREEPYQADVIKKFGVRAIVGKGGMGDKTGKALQELGGVYLNAIGGAAQFYADCVTSVNGVDFLEFGIPEAMWHLNVQGVKAVVTMDTFGNSLHKDTLDTSFEKLQKLK